MENGKPFPPGFKPELVLRPVIRELARTQVCFPDLKLLVDRISTVTLPATEHSPASEAYRLYLTDGDRTIQGVIYPSHMNESSKLKVLSHSCAKAKMPQPCDKL